MMDAEHIKHVEHIKDAEYLKDVCKISKESTYTVEHLKGEG